MNVTEILTGATTLTCGQCGIAFAVPDPWYNQRRNDHSTFYCPNGHPRCFLGKSDAEKLRDELAQVRTHHANALAWARDEMASKQRAQRQAAALRGVVTRTKNRVAKGKCPCCRKQFPDLAAHMQGEHPDYGSPDDA